MVRDKAVTARHAEGLSNREYVLFLNLSGILRTELWSPGIYTRATSARRAVLRAVNCKEVGCMVRYLCTKRWF